MALRYNVNVKEAILRLGRFPQDAGNRGRIDEDTSAMAEYVCDNKLQNLWAHFEVKCGQNCTPHVQSSATAQQAKYSSGRSTTHLRSITVLIHCSLSDFQHTYLRHSTPFTHMATLDSPRDIEEAPYAFFRVHRCSLASTRIPSRAKAFVTHPQIASGWRF